MGGSNPSGQDVPQVIGPYHIVHMVGEGGMGVVWAAEQLEPVRRRVAVKMLRPGADSGEVLARFEAERRTLALMDHPGIAKVLDAGVTDDGRPYFVMELVRGIPIDAYCDRFRLTVRERVDLFIHLCQAVQHAHQKGIIHRDLKPTNVLVAEQDGVPLPKIIDFGIAKATGHSPLAAPLLTSQGMAPGTLAYMSPEQAEGQDLDVDTRADIYSLGIMLYQVLAGQVPLDPREKGAAPFLAQLIARDAPFPPLASRIPSAEEGERVAAARGTTVGALRATLAGDVAWVVMKALDKDRARRYDTANALAMELRRWLDGEAVLARPPSAAYRAGKFVRRHRGVAAASAVAVLALAGGAVAATAAMLRARAAEDVAQAAEQRAADEARTARQVSDFLIELFEVNEPGTARGGAVTAREILDRGARRVERELAGEPLVQARMLAAMGTVYQGLGLYDDALGLLGRALTVREAILPPAHPEVGESLVRLGVLQRIRGDLPASEDNLRRALGIQEGAFGPDAHEVGHALYELGGTVLARGRPDEAEPLLRRALAIEERALGEEHRTVAGILQELGTVAYYQGEMAQASQYWARAVGIRERQLGEDHPEVATGLNNLGGVYYLEGRYDQALEAYERAREIWARTLEPGHPRFGTILTNIGETYAALGRLQDAEPLLVEALAVKERTLSPDEPSIATTLRVLADVYREMGRYREAEPRYRRALAIMEGVFGPTHPRLAEHLDGYARLLRATGRSDEAARLDERRAALSPGA